MGSKIDDFSAKWKLLTKSQKFSLLGIIAPLLMLPVSLYLVYSATNLQARASRRPLPVSPPETNSVPVILTEYLPIASVGRNYRERVDGFDADLNDQLEFRFRNLPAGFLADDCRQTVRGGMRDKSNERVSYIVCSVNGVVEEEGLFEIEVILTDSKGASVTKIFNLQAE